MFFQFLKKSNCLKSPLFQNFNCGMELRCDNFRFPPFQNDSSSILKNSYGNKFDLHENTKDTTLTSLEGSS